MPTARSRISKRVCELVAHGDLRRVHIIGGPGAGKSTLARDVAGEFALPLFALDEIAYAPPDFTNRPYDECARRVGQIVELDEWVCEGVHLGWTEPLFERAEVIIWLDHVGWLKSVRRVTRRSAVFAIHEARSRTARDRFLRFDDYARNLRLLLSTVMRSREYWYGQQAPRRYAATRVQVAAALQRRAAKVFHVTDSAGRECVRPMVIRERPAFPR